MLRTEEIIPKLDNKEITLVDVYQTYRQNIENLNKKFNALPTIQHDYFSTKHIKDVHKQHSSSLFRGLPVVVKDTIMTKGIKTTAGSSKFRDFVPNENAASITNILDAGGKILAKSNTPELSLDVQTFNDIFGITSNPYDSSKTAGGSSGGSAASVALGMTSMALGSDLAGSLRIPSAYCGVKSLRPTFERVDSSGHIPPAPEKSFSGHSLVIGPISNSIAGLEILMQALTRTSQPGNRMKQYKPVPQLDKDNFKIKITPQIQGLLVSDQVEKGMHNLIEILQENNFNYQIDEPKLDFNSIRKAHKTFYDDSFNSVIDKDKSPIVNKSINLSQLELAFKVRRELTITLQEFIGENNIWMLPVTSIQPFPHNPDHIDFTIKSKNVGYWGAMINYSLPFSVTGLPVAVMPVDMIEGLPFGIQIIGHKWKDEELMAACKSLEHIFDSKVDLPSGVQSHIP